MSLQSFLSCPVDVELPVDVFVNEKIKRHGAATQVYKDENWLGRVFHTADFGSLLQKYQVHVLQHPPQTFTAKHIHREYTRLPKKEEFEPQFTIVQGLDALLLPSSPMAKQSIVQVASQFNGLEGTDPKTHTSLRDYPRDYTQGPRVVMPCAHALLKREALFQNGTPFNSFNKLYSTEQLHTFGLKHGYLQWENDPQSVLNSFYDDMSFRLGQLLIMPMWCKPELADHLLIQVPTAAPPTNAYGNEGNSATQVLVAKALVGEQYRVLAELAAIKSVVTSQKTALHLTFLGQGVFNNDPSVFTVAIKNICSYLTGFNVHVFLHAYTPEDVQLGLDVFKKQGIEPEVILAEKYMQMRPVQRRRRVRRASCPREACGLWNEVVDTVAPVFNSRYEKRCEDVSD
jgi:hypothetical protein